MPRSDVIDAGGTSGRVSRYVFAPGILSTTVPPSTLAIRVMLAVGAIWMITGIDCGGGSNCAPAGTPWAMIRKRERVRVRKNWHLAMKLYRPPQNS